MALSLTAKQKNLLKIFKIEEQYIIPPFQRPYSWGYDQCFQLYNDLMDAYKSNEDYFIGNIIIAKSEANEDTLEVIDGQQRLTTLLLLIKILYIFQSDYEILEEILEQKDWKGQNTIQRIKSEIFETNDGKHLNAILKYDKAQFEKRRKECKNKKGKFNEKKFRNKFERNILYLYEWILFFVEKNGNDAVEKFIKYLLRKVYLLPIALVGKTQEEANEKALVIFETMNNRGMSLEDADIFKAKLYKKAKDINEEQVFIELWKDLKNNTENLGLEVDDIFRYYSHIIRGQQEITVSEKNLREFFTVEKFSPFEEKTYKELLDDLFNITEILEFINQEKNKESKLAKWLQLIETYTNQYPKFAVTTYFFVNGFSVDEKLITFLESLVRYIYSQGSTTTVKWEIYNIIKGICLNQKIKNYYHDFSTDDFNYLGRLKYGFSLLSFYIDKDKALSHYSIDKIISIRDKKNLNGGWTDVKLKDVTDILGNFVVLDIPKKNIPFTKKVEYYRTSNIPKVQEILAHNFTITDLKNRDKCLKENLVKFFKEN